MKLFQSIITCALIFSFPMYAEDIEKVVILGGGTAGLTAAIYTGQVNLSPVVVEGNNSGQTTAVYRMENYPGFPEGISGEDLISKIHVQAEKFGTRFQAGNVIDVDVTSRPFALTFDDGSLMYAETVILALGTSKRWLDLPSESALMGKGVSGSATADAAFFKGKDVIVVGGGDAALEEALLLAKHASKVTIIHRSHQFMAADYLKQKVFENDKISVIWDSSVDEILDVSKGFVTGVILHNLKSDEITQLACEGVFISIGRKANTDIFKGQIELASSGLVHVEAPGTQTSIPGVFAAGDISDPTYRKAITAAASGCMAAIDVIRYLEASREK